LYTKMSASAFKEFVKGSRDTVMYWCRHAAAEVRFEGETVNQPFDLDSPVRVTCETQGTVAVLALTEASPAFYGFYNQGITLLEGYHDYIAGVSFKVKSRYLEHTLTRDNVMQDENYAKAMAIVERQVDEALLPRFLACLEAAAREADREHWQRVFALGERFLARAWEGDGRQREVLRCLGGEAVSYAALRRGATSLGGLCHELGGASGARVLFDTEVPQALLDALRARGIRVVEGAENHRVIKALKLLGLATVRATTLLTVPLEVAMDALPAGAAQLLARTLDVLRQSGISLGGGRWARFDAAVAGRPYLLQPSPAPMALLQSAAALGEDERPAAWPLSLLQRGHVVLNLEHPLNTRLLAAWHTRPSFAAYQLAKLLCLADGVHAEVEERLLAWAFDNHGATTR